MTPLAGHIQSLNTNDINEITNSLSEEIVVEKISIQQSFAAASAILTDEECELVAATLDVVCQNSFAMRENRESLRGLGLDWSTDRFQTQLFLLGQAGNWPNDVTKKLQELGIKKKYKYQIIGLNQLPSNEEINLAIQEIEQESNKQELLNWMNNKFNSIMNSIHFGELSTHQEIINFMGE